jgi:hypothetical protein
MTLQLNSVSSLIEKYKKIVNILSLQNGDCK